MKKISLLSCAGIMFLASCGIKSESTLENNSYRGEISLENGSVASYESSKDEAGEINTMINVNGKEISIDFGAEGQLKSVNADTKITAEDKAILKELVAHMSASQPTGEQEYLRNKTAVMVEYLSEAPEDHLVPSRTFETDLSLYNEGVKCIKKGQWVYAQWDTSSGQVRGESVKTNANWGGNYGCMGRCGGGCGWGAPSSYTKDCMDHDVCSKRHNSSSGSSDPNCGDEYNQAMDDWAHGWPKCPG